MGREPAAAFLSEGVGMQPCAPVPWLDRKQQASPLPSLTFCVSLQAEARLREETASDLGC